MMATRGKAKVAVTVVPTGYKGEASEYTCLVVPGESITIRCEKQTRQERAGFVALVDSLTFDATERGVRDWLYDLPFAEQRELGNLLAGRLPPPLEDDGAALVAADWVEEHGGRREWVSRLVHRPCWVPVVEPVERTYRVGEQAVYHSYNLYYFGTITSITAKTVTISHRHGGQSSRLKLYDFCNKNWGDPSKKHEANDDWTD